MQLGYPILLSNKVDPFANSNYKQAEATIYTLLDSGFQIAFQTRGGNGEAHKALMRVLDVIPPSAFYISINTLDEELRKRLEPGGTAIAYRLDLISELVRRGHHVALGMNPLVREWLPEPVALLHEVYSRGVRHVWIEMLHFNRDQVATMSERERTVIGDEIIRRSIVQREPNIDDFEFFMAAREQAQMMGFEVFSIGQYTKSLFFEPYKKLYRNLFPIMQDFINWCYDNKEDGEAVYFDDFRPFISSLPQGRFDIGHYLGNAARNIWKSHDIGNWMTFEELFKLIWADHRIKYSPLRYMCFSYAVSDGAILVDEDDLPVIIFTKGLRVSPYIECVVVE